MKLNIAVEDRSAELSAHQINDLIETGYTLELVKEADDDNH